MSSLIRLDSSWLLQQSIARIETAENRTGRDSVSLFRTGRQVIHQDRAKSSESKIVAREGTKSKLSGTLCLARGYYIVGRHCNIGGHHRAIPARGISSSMQITASPAW